MKHHRARHRCLRAAAPLLGLLAIAVPTAQAADWTPAIDIGPSATAPVGALSGSGDAVAAWHTANAVAIYRSHTTATWGAPFVSAEAVSAQPAVSAAGNSAVVAYESAGIVYAAVHESGGWQAAASFGPGTEPEVGVDASGDALLVWLDDTGTVMQAVRSAGGSWSAGGAMSLPGADDLDLAVNPAGAAIASWRTPITGAHAILGGTGSGFPGTGSAIDLTATGTTEVDAAIGSDGTAVVVWADNGAIRAGYRANGGGGSFDIDTVVAGPADSAAVAVDSNGLALVGWRTGAGEVQWSSSTNGAWSGSGATLGAGGAAGTVVAAANGAGADLALGWVSSAAATAVRPAGGSWGTELHDSGTTASVAVDTAGDVLSLWQGVSGARTATFDSSAPTLLINVPGTAVAGESVPLSASGGDLWSSGLNNPTWDFGDGSPDGSGFNVQHAWSSAGSKTVTVNMTDAAGNAAAPATDTISITAAPPTNSVAPSISGAAYRDGTVLTAANGSWTGAPTSFDHQWQRCEGACANIAGAGNATYTPGAADVGSSLRVIVTASNAGGDATATSAETPVIAPRNTSLPVVSGPVLLDAQTLTTTNGGWNGLTESTTPVAVTFTRQWQRCDSSGGSCGDIAGATGFSYVLDAPDVGARIRSIVTASRNGAATSAVSSATGVIAPLNTSGPVIAGAGSAADGSPLSVATGNSSNAWGDAAGLSFTYEWKRCDQNGNSCNSVVGTNPTYTPGAADVGLRLRLAITAHVNGASTTSDDSAVPTEKIAPRNTVAPVVDGAPHVDGQVLSASQGSWNGATGLTFTYQWRRCDSAGANCVNLGTGPTVTLGPADVGMRHGLVVSASKNGSAADAADSGLTSATVAPLATSPAAVGGFAQDAATLTATPGGFNGVSDLTYRYQWQRCSPGCSDIAGATAATYTPVAGDVGNTIRVSVDARKNNSNWTEGQIWAPLR